MKNNKIKLTPTITYHNINVNKSFIFFNNKGKSGIYRWNNLVTGKSYVGSSKDLSNRLRVYCSTNIINKIISKESSIIYRAILKYGYSSFSVDILEYCEVDMLREREQYYFDLLKPEYNILKFAGSRLNHKLSFKTKKAVSIALRGRKYSIKNSNIKANHIPIITRPKSKLSMSLKAVGLSVKIYDKAKNLVNEFSSIASAAKYYGVSCTYINNIKKRGFSYDDYIYKFEIKDTKVWVYDCNKNLIKIFDNISKVSELFNIPRTTLYRYIKSGKLYENTYYFHKTKLNLEKPKCTISPNLSNKLSKETKQLISNTLKNRLVKLLPLKITNIETNAIKYFSNNKEAAKYLGTSETTLGRYKSKGKILLKKYTITNDIIMHKSYKQFN